MCVGDRGAGSMVGRWWGEEGGLSRGRPGSFQGGWGKCVYVREGETDRPRGR